MLSRPEYSNLPALTPAQQQHVESVHAALCAALAGSAGWLGFEKFLQLVMYAPGLGYYSAGSAKFGAGGDFVTAPELGALFGQCVARQCAPLLRQLVAAAGSADILELGAGTGRLAVDVLGRLESLDALPEHYWILEVSADLRARQQALIATLPPQLGRRVAWLDALPSVPLRGLILANEVADAVPFRRFVVGNQGLAELGVAAGAQAALQLQERPADASLTAEFQRVAADLAVALPTGYTSEVCPMLDAWVVQLAAALDAGALMLFDYGVGRREYYHPKRSSGTLRCHYRHRAHDDVLMHPGLQDISAWVDFSRIAAAASTGGLQISAYCTLAAFLLGAGIEVELAAASTDLARARLAHEARQLLLPNEMGESFKCMLLTRNLEAEALRFAPQDLRRQL